MTWHTFFSFGSMENRHLLASYLVVFGIQGGYFAYVAWAWFHPKSPKL